MAILIPKRRKLSAPELRFELRPYGDASAGEIYAAADESRGHVAPWMDWLKPGYSVADAAAWRALAVGHWATGSAFEFLIYDREDGEIAGSGGLNEINHKDLVCNLGYWVRASKLRLGAAHAATLLLRDFGFHELRLNRLEIVVATGNLPSQRVAESVGAIFEGVQHQRLKVREQILDARMYALLNPLGK